MTPALLSALTDPALVEAARRFNAAVATTLVDLNRRLEEARTMTTTTAREHLPGSAEHPGYLVTTGQAATLLPTYLGPVLTAAGVRAYGWDVRTNAALPFGHLIVRPANLTVTVPDEGTLEAALMYAEERRQAAHALRSIVVGVAGRWFDDLRPFARPARGATR